MRNMVVMVLSVMAVACGSSNQLSTDQCSQNVTATCPASPPSYLADIAPLIQARCATCHGPGGEEEDRNLTTYAGIVSLRDDVQNEVGTCDMPPEEDMDDSKGIIALTADEQKLLLTWLACGAPQN
jgi:hypothetical protein